MLKLLTAITLFTCCPLLIAQEEVDTETSNNFNDRNDQNNHKLNQIRLIWSSLSYSYSLDYIDRSDSATLLSVGFTRKLPWNMHSGLNLGILQADFYDDAQKLEVFFGGSGKIDNRVTIGAEVSVSSINTGSDYSFWNPGLNVFTDVSFGNNYLVGFKISRVKAEYASETGYNISLGLEF